MRPKIKSETRLGLKIWFVEINGCRVNTFLSEQGAISYVLRLENYLTIGG